MNKIKYFLGICTLSFSPLFTSCSSDIDEPFIEVKEKQTLDKVWETQLNDALRKQTRSSSNELFLMGYSYDKDIESAIDLDEGLDEIFADSSYIAFQNLRTHDDIEIYTIGEVKRSKDDLIRNQFNLEKLREEIYTIIHQLIVSEDNLHIIKLKWAYNGKLIYSTAIASAKKGVIFDTIGYMVVSDIQFEEDDSEVMATIKNRSEGNHTISKIKRFNKSVNIKTISNITVCSISLVGRSEFNSEGILIGRNINTTCINAPTYSAEADMQYISGVPYSSSHNEFSWSWKFQHKDLLSLVFDVVNINISGTTASQNGTVIHTAN